MLVGGTCANTCQTRQQIKDTIDQHFLRHLGTSTAEWVASHGDSARYYPARAVTGTLAMCFEGM
jgi:hypothetical protein